MDSQADKPGPEPEKVSMPEDPADTAPTSSDESEPSAGSSAGGSSIDTIIGRMVIEQGFATADEVQNAIENKQEVPDTKDESLAEFLIRRDLVTKNQIKRLKGMVEAERSGQQIPGFRILGKLGAGAMATVFKGKQLSLDRTVAIKVLPRKFSKNQDFINRFYDEGRAAAQLNHPNIVQAFDVGQAGEFHYFVMEYVDGSTVYEQIIRHKRYSETDAIDIAIQIAEALQHAHERNLIHRDVKPKNVMITSEGVAKLADMGLARAMTDKEAAEAEQGKAFGTPYYISPEQIRGEKDITPAADIYSLGSTLYHMVTGAVPFDGKNPTDVMRKHLKAELVPPDHVNPKLSAGISQVIEMMMSKTVARRYDSCNDLLTDLRAIRKGEAPVIARNDMAGLDLETVASAEQSAQADIAEDKTSLHQDSPLTHPFVQVLLIIAIVLFVLNIVQWLLG
ncbi:MAG: serine/threonine protein kinase [Planctomycetota bacterium]|jgi:serine/threonine-protein kinase